MSEKFTDEQVKWALSEIAGKAYSALELCNEAIAKPGDCTQPAMLTGVEALLQQIGWIADHHGAHTHGDATAWMLPPKYHQAAERAKS